MLKKNDKLYKINTTTNRLEVVTFILEDFDHDPLFSYWIVKDECNNRIKCGVDSYCTSVNEACEQYKKYLQEHIDNLQKIINEASCELENTRIRLAFVDTID